MLGNQFLLLSLSDIGFEGDIPETQPTLEGNALQKARFIFDRFHIPCFADDTGLEVKALQGEPGVYSARYAGDLAKYGNEENRSEANMEKLLDKLLPHTDRSARFRTVIAYLTPDGEFLFDGTVEGRIALQKEGKEGFGYDPLFIPEGYDRSFATMNLHEKNQISHRSRAFIQFVTFLKNPNNTINSKQIR